MPKLQLLLVLVVFTARAHAQTPDAPTVPPLGAITAATPAPRAAADSALAVRNLFQKRRTGGAVFTTIGTGFSLAILRGLASGSTGGNAAGGVASIAVLGLLPAGVGVGKLTRFSKVREEEIVTAYGQGKPLPSTIRRRLKAGYFN